MDTGVMADGTPVQAKYGKPPSAKRPCWSHTNGALEALQKQQADFMLLQEVDVKADRSYKVDQTELLRRGPGGLTARCLRTISTRRICLPLQRPARRGGRGA